MAQDQRPGRIVNRNPGMRPATVPAARSRSEPEPLPMTIPPRSVLSSAGWSIMLVSLSFAAVAGGLTAAIMVLRGLG